ncbi:ribosome-inactivating family protein [Streptosporangium sp. NPDC002524]|uniref:ribosome-inactivating family protein n=1 Tax=Streptosporangium sp. NPDC002524 TaxID=3154537 RepID=UPI003332C236
MVFAEADVLTGHASLSFAEGEVPSRERFQAVVTFLRARFVTYAARFDDSDYMCVDIGLPDERSVQVYFKKEDLYLVGWTIDGDYRKYIGVGPAGTPCPPSVTRINLGEVVGLRYGDATKNVWLCASVMQKALEGLYAHLQYKRGGHADKPESLQRDFDVLARMTAEMARFDGYCQSFKEEWHGAWNQSAPRTIGGHELGCFNDVVTKWDKFAKKAEGGGEMLTWPGTTRPVTTDEARAAIGEGVTLRRGAAIGPAGGR